MEQIKKKDDVSRSYVLVGINTHKTDLEALNLLLKIESNYDCDVKPSASIGKEDEYTNVKIGGRAFPVLSISGITHTFLFFSESQLGYIMDEIDKLAPTSTQSKTPNP